MAALKFVFVLLHIIQSFYCYTYGTYKPDLRLIYQEYFSVDAVADAYDHRLISINANETIHFMKAGDVSGQDGFIDVNDCTANRIDIFLGSHDGKGYNFTIELYHDDSIKEEPQDPYNTGVGRVASKGDSVVYTLCIPFGIMFFARILH